MKNFVIGEKYIDADGTPWGQKASEMEFTGYDDNGDPVFKANFINQKGKSAYSEMSVFLRQAQHFLLVSK